MNSNFLKLATVIGVIVLVLFLAKILLHMTALLLPLIFLGLAIYGGYVLIQRHLSDDD